MTQDNPLEVGAWFSQGWAAYVKNARLLIAVSAIYGIFDLFLIWSTYIPHGVIIYLFGELVITPPLAIGWYFLNVRVIRNESATVSDLFNGFSRFGAAWTTYVLFFLIVMGGSILFIIPGIIWGLKYSQSIYAVMDKQLSGPESIRYSGRITAGYKMKIFLVWLCVLLLSLITEFPLFLGLHQIYKGSGSTMLLIGSLPFLIGIIVIMPWLVASMACAYHNLALKYDMTQKENTVPVAQ
jgi:uncharacterized membrane protein